MSKLCMILYKNEDKLHKYIVEKKDLLKGLIKIPYFNNDIYITNGMFRKIANDVYVVGVDTKHIDKHISTLSKEDIFKYAYEMLCRNLGFIILDHENMQFLRKMDDGDYRNIESFINEIG